MKLSVTPTIFIVRASLFGLACRRWPDDVGCNGNVRLGVRKHLKVMQQTLHLIKRCLAPTHVYFSQYQFPVRADDLLYKCPRPWLSPSGLVIALVLLSLCLSPGERCSAVTELSLTAFPLHDSFFEPLGVLVLLSKSSNDECIIFITYI